MTISEQLHNTRIQIIAILISAVAIWAYLRLDVQVGFKDTRNYADWLAVSAKGNTSTSDERSPVKSLDAANHSESLDTPIHGPPYSFFDPRLHINRSVQRAKVLLASRNSTNRGDRLLIPLLSSRFPLVCAYIDSMAQHVFTQTPADVFVFSVDNGAEAVVTTSCAEKLQNVYFLPLDEFWETPPEAGPEASWEGPGKGSSYRRMGHWRLLFQFAFADRLGYQYSLQTDDDSLMMSDVGYNMVTDAREKKVVIMARSIMVDIPSVNKGLAELTRPHPPTTAHPPATLFENCDPPSLEGLFSGNATQDHRESITPDVSEAVSGKGWNYVYLYGNCLLIDVQKLWFREDVQRYISLVVSSGGHFRFRWNEQSVISMVWTIFVPDDQFGLFEFEYKHGDSLFKKP